MPYKVYRYSQSGRKRLVRRNLTEADAQAYCRRPDTHGKNWFCGYTKQ